MRPIDVDLPDGPSPAPGGGDGDGGGSGGGYIPPGDPTVIIPGVDPGVATFVRRRYTSNVAITEEMLATDLIHEVINLSSRMYLSQGANGQIRFHNKKPADWGYIITSPPDVGDTVLEVDDVRPWVASVRGLIILDPHTTASEVRAVTSATYPTSANSIGLTSSHANISVTAFSGASGGSTPATATITVNAITGGATYTIVLDGEPVPFTVTTDDTTTSLAATIAAVMRTHPRVGRRWGYAEAGSVVTVTERYGDLHLAAATEEIHLPGVINPSTAPALTASGSGTALLAGDYSVAYAFTNHRGETLPSPYQTITITAGQQINAAAVTPISGATGVRWYVMPSANSNKLRFYLENNGSGHAITSLPKLTATPPADLDGTWPQIMRVAASFSDRRLARADANRSNVLMASYAWSLSDRKKLHNQISLKYREALDDFRLVELIEKDDAHIAKVKKVNKREVNGQAIDNYYQAKRIALALLAEELDANFNYAWESTRKALLLEEGDVVAITDSGSGVVNLPIWIEEIEISGRRGMPRVSFTGMKYWTELWDDSIREKTVPIVIG
jgi:hypothetical protein